MIGSGAVAGLATESTYGTYAASTVWLTFSSSSMNGGPKLERPGHLLPVGAAAGHHTPRDLVKVAVEAGGDLEWVPTYDQRGTSVMLRHCMHAEPTTAGAGPYTHTYELGDSSPGLSVQQLDGTDGVWTDLARRFDGCVVSSFEISASAGGFLKAKASLIAQGVTNPQALSGTIAVTDGEEIVAGHGAAAGLSWNSGSYYAESITVRCDHGIVRTPYIGSYETGKPARNAHTSITITAKIYTSGADAEDLSEDYAALVSSDLVATFTGSTAGNSLEITGQNAKLTKADRGVTSAGIVYYDCEWQCSGSAPKTGLKIVLGNGNNDWE